MIITYKKMSNCERTKCAACEFGKGHRQPNKLKKMKNNPIKEKDLKKDHILPGNNVNRSLYIAGSK